MPRVPLATQVVIVQHAAERYKPTGTARLVRKMFDNTSILVYGRRDVAFNGEQLTAFATDAALLFPGCDAEPLERVATRPADELKSLIVLDGTWSQCSRMAQRIPPLRAMRRVSLPVGIPSPWTLRRSADPTRLCTFEATLRALALLEGWEPTVQSALREAEGAFHKVTARALYMRSRLPSIEVPKRWTLALP